MNHLTASLAVCAWPGCQRSKLRSKGLCYTCYRRAERAGVIDLYVDPRKVGRLCMTCSLPIPEAMKVSATTCSRACNHRRWCETNPERAKAGRAGWYEQNRDVTLARAAERYAADPEAHRARVAAWKAANRDLVRSHQLSANSRRRAAAAAAFVEHLDLTLVWARDAGCCWLCETPIDSYLRRPDPRSMSVDHIIPLAKGGAHAMSNVALAHFGCNAAKQDKVLDRVPAWAA